MQFTSQKIKKITQEGNKSSIEFYDVPPMDNIPQIDDAVFKPKGKDTIPAMLTPGEAIIPAEAVDAYPDAVMRLIKAGRSIQDKRDSKVPLENPNIVDTNQNKIMQANHGGIAYANTGLSDMIKSYEGYNPNIYKDAANYAFGYGTNFYPSTYRTGVRNRVSPDNSQMIEFAPEEEKERFAENMLGAAIDDAEKMVDSLKLDLNETQKEALTSSVFQMGIGTFKSNDKMVKALKDKNYDTFADEFINAGVYVTNPKTGKKEKIPGLVNRRKEELNYFFQEPAVSNPLIESETPILDRGPDYAPLPSLKNSLSEDENKVLEEQLVKPNISSGMVVGPSGQLIYPSDYDFSKFGSVPHGNYIGPDGERFDTRIKNNIPSTYSGIGNMYYDEFGELYDDSERMPSSENKYAGFRPDEINIPVVSGHSGDIGSILTPEQQLTQPINLEELLGGTEPVLPMPESELGNVPEIPIINENITPVDNNFDSNLSKVFEEEVASSVSVTDIINKTSDSENNNIPKDDNKMKEASEQAPKGFFGNILSKFNDILGRALDEDAIAKMALHYTGSRVLGYDHQSSLNHSAKVAIDTMEANQKLVDAWIAKNGDDYELKSLALFKRTHNFGDLIPKDESGIKKALGFGFDKKRLTKIPKVELMNGQTAFVIDGVPITLDQIIDNDILRNRINIDYTDTDDSQKLSEQFIKRAEVVVKSINREIKDIDGAVNPINEVVLADQMVDIYNELKKTYQFTDEKSKSMIIRGMNAANKKFGDAIIKAIKDEETPPTADAYAAFLDSELVALKTGSVFSKNDTKNTNEENLQLLLGQAQLLKGDMRSTLENMKKLWNNSKNRYSYKKKDAFDGWDNMTKWMYDFMTDPEDESVLKVVYPMDKVNAFLASNPRDPSLLE